MVAMVSVRLRRLVALLMLLCMPFQVLAALDGPLCAEQGYGDAGLAASAPHDASSDEHESLDFGGLVLDSCALCHIGCAPLVRDVVVDLVAQTPRGFIPTLGAACIEHDPLLSFRPPRAWLT